MTQNLKEGLRIKLTAQIMNLLLLLPRLEGKEKSCKVACVFWEGLSLYVSDGYTLKQELYQNYIKWIHLKQYFIA